MNIFQRIKARTPKKNRKLAKFFGWIGGVSCTLVGLASSGVIDLPPVIETILTVSCGCLAPAVWHQQKVLK